MLYTHTFRPPASPKKTRTGIFGCPRPPTVPIRTQGNPQNPPPEPRLVAPKGGGRRPDPFFGQSAHRVRRSGRVPCVSALFSRAEKEGKGASGSCLGAIVSLCKSMQAGRPASSISRQDSSPEWPSDRLDFLLSQRPFPQKDDRTKELPCGRRRTPETRNGHPSAHQVCYGMGNRTVKVVPTPISLATLTSPPYKPAMCLTMDNPRPVPPSSRLRPLSTR